MKSREMNIELLFLFDLLCLSFCVPLYLCFFYQYLSLSVHRAVEVDDEVVVGAEAVPFLLEKAPEDRRVLCRCQCTREVRKDHSHA